jgi:hypothetical protein
MNVVLCSIYYKTKKYKEKDYTIKQEGAGRRGEHF